MRNFKEIFMCSIFLLRGSGVDRREAEQGLSLEPKGEGDKEESGELARQE